MGKTNEWALQEPFRKINCLWRNVMLLYSINFLVLTWTDIKENNLKQKRGNNPKSIVGYNCPRTINARFKYSGSYINTTRAKSNFN